MWVDRHHALVVIHVTMDLPGAVNIVVHLVRIIVQE